MVFVFERNGVDSCAGCGGGCAVGSGQESGRGRGDVGEGVWRRLGEME